MRLYRIYIDEIGNHDMQVKTVTDPNARFLILFGVIVEREYMLHTLQPEMNKIKRDFFQHDPDEPIIFHRKDMARMRGQFRSLGSREKRQRFGDTMLDAYRRWHFTSICVTIDKKTHLALYGENHRPPYNYCLHILMERYVLFLRSKHVKGDAMIEARGKREDKELSTAYNTFFLAGSGRVKSEIWQTHLTTRQLKINPKKDNVVGLQIADLLGHAAHYDNLQENSFIVEQKSDYGREISKILREEKYRRSPYDGTIIGFGMKMLP